MQRYLQSDLAAACAGYRRLSRRNWLAATAAAATATGSCLTQFSERLAAASESSGQRPKSLLFIWLQGGPSQLETFDPHPRSWIGGEVKAISSSIPGVQVADSLPATAEVLHLATLVRSATSREGDHERASYHVKTGWRPDPTLIHPAIGSIVCRQSENNIEIPRHISILPSQWPARGGYLGPRYDAFQTGDPAERIPNLTARVEDARLLSRTRLLETLENEFQKDRIQNLDQNRTLHQSATRDALKMMSSEQLAAFDVQAEGLSTVAKFGDMAFGRGCLAAVRLLSAGVRCVEVELNGWDSHINNHQLQVGQAQFLDAALAATLRELDQREMLDNTVVFCGGEFGRTPQINPAGGRDHWPHGFSVLLAGGRFRRGHVYGATDPNPDRKLVSGDSKDRIDPTKLVQQPISVPDLHATMLHALDIDPQIEVQTPIGRPMRLSDGKVIQELLMKS